MAVSMAATLSLSTGNASIVAGQRFTASVKLTESGGTNTNLVSIQPFALNATGQVAQNVHLGNVANSLTIGNYTGAAVVITANSSFTFNFECVVDSPITSNQPGEGTSFFTLGVTCQTSDGSVFNATAGFNVTASSQASPNGQTQIIGSTTNAYGNILSPGYLRFDQANTSLLALPFV
jgi:hypothetical protein